MSNNQKLREALMSIRGIVSSYGHKFIRTHILRLCNSALSAPPRNCDVGTAEEQNLRHGEWCHKHGIDGDGDVNCASPDMHCHLCFARWAQMPYETETKTTKGK